MSEQDTEKTGARENAEQAEKTTSETVDTNAGSDAVQGTVADADEEKSRKTAD